MHLLQGFLITRKHHIHQEPFLLAWFNLNLIMDLMT